MNLYFFHFLNYSYCNSTHYNTGGKVKVVVQSYLPELFQPNILCAGYESAEQGSCQGDSGGPLMVYNTTLLQFFQVGIVSGGVTSSCGDRDIPGYYARLDFPEVADFVRSVKPSQSKGNKTGLQPVSRPVKRVHYLGGGVGVQKVSLKP